MPDQLAKFEQVVRRSGRFDESGSGPTANLHPFELRNIHHGFPDDVLKLFDNGHFPQATFEAYKFIDEEVQRVSGDSDFGKSLMMRMFGGAPPKLALNNLSSSSELSEQEGYKFLFAGAMQAVRNPRGHKSGVSETVDWCLDHLSFASMLLRRLEQAGLR